MSWRNAPLYIEAHDLAVWLLKKTATWNEPHALCLVPRISNTACDLVDAAALALTFPAQRSQHLSRLDASIVVLRTELRLAETLGLVSSRGLRHVCDRLQPIGRMVGGWRKRVERREARKVRPQASGGEPPAVGSV